MNIILASAEVAPFAKRGGLGDIAQFLPVDWEKFGQNSIVIMPKYRDINVDFYGFKPTYRVLYVPLGNWTEFAHLWEGRLPDTNVPVYLVENDDYYNRDGIYGNPDEFPDNDRRFIFFSRAVFEAAKSLNFKPDIIHAHDYHTAFTMAFLKSHYRYDPLFNQTAGVYTIHNLAYQGWFDPDRAMFFSTFGIKEFYPGCWFEHYGKVNAMKTGIMFADKITTVSPTYANEIRTDYYSEGLQSVLNLRGADLIGVLNGVLYSEWNPAIDEHINHKYDSNSLVLKSKNKFDFLKQHNIGDSDNPDMPLIGMISRLTEQKGLDLLIDKLEYYLDNNILRFVLLGSGEARYADFFKYIQWKYPGKALIHLGYNNTLSHQIIAACDYLVLPSRFEPCGMTQMFALKYGTIPIVRQTGGLADTVFEYIPATGTGNGFTFWQYNSDDFAYAIRRALSIYHQEPHWTIIRKNAMACDYSSSRSALEYLKVFTWALEKVR
jgi:starch synthase